MGEGTAEELAEKASIDLMPFCFVLIEYWTCPHAVLVVT